MKSENINEIIKALVLSQQEIKKAIKDGKNPHFNSRFASLESVMDACLPILNKNGIAVTQQTAMAESPEPAKFLLVLKTFLYHTSGQWLFSDYPIIPVKNDPQSYGSALSYARRYSLEAIACVGSEDDDGEAAMNRPGAEKKTIVMNDLTKTKSAAPTLSEGAKNTVPGYDPRGKPTAAQIKRLFAIMHSARWTEEELKTHMHVKYNKASTKDLLYDEYEDLCRTMVAHPMERPNEKYSSESPH